MFLRIPKAVIQEQITDMLTDPFYKDRRPSYNGQTANHLSFGRPSMALIVSYLRWAVSLQPILSLWKCNWTCIDYRSKPLTIYRNKERFGTYQKAAIMRGKFRIDNSRTPCRPSSYKKEQTKTPCWKRVWSSVIPKARTQQSSESSGRQI